jgi:hypothetical protein
MRGETVPLASAYMASSPTTEGRRLLKATTSWPTIEAIRTWRPTTASSHASFTGRPGAPATRVSSKPGIERKTLPSSSGCA